MQHFFLSVVRAIILCAGCKRSEKAAQENWEEEIMFVEAELVRWSKTPVSQLHFCTLLKVRLF